MTRTCLVTGGGTGIGAEVARVFARQGYRVAINGRRPAPLEAIAAEIDGVPLPGDTAEPDGARRVVDEAVARLGSLDCVVLNAGISRSGSVLEQTPESFNEVLRVNLVGAFLVARAALVSLCERRGCLVAVASQAALLAGPDSAAYCTSKAGLVMLIKTIAVDFAQQGVRANAVCPAWVRTPMADESMDALGAGRGLDREQAYRYANRLVPQQRPATPAEVAAVVYFLASDAASYINGVALPVDGGASIIDVGLMFGDSPLAAPPVPRA